MYCISPGLDMRYSDEADLAILGDKLRSVAALGVDDFGLLLDDIPRDLQHPEDRAAFDDLASAHVHVANRVFAGLGPGKRLTVCPTVYWGTGTEPYLVRLGAGIDPRIDLFWTGRAICSPTLDLADAATFARSTNRPVTYWDNYPVNDVAMCYELHIGPYRGRDPLLWRAATGIIANGMELFESSRIPFATIADYLRDAGGIRPGGELAAGAPRRRGRGGRWSTFALFADNVRSSCLAVDDAPIVGRALEAFLFRVDRGEGVAAAAELGALADRMLAAAAHLLRGPVVNRALIEEARPWLVAFELGAQAIRAMADLAATDRLDSRRTGRAAAVPDPAASGTRARVRRRPGDDLVRPDRDDVPAGRGPGDRRRRHMSHVIRRAATVAFAAALATGGLAGGAVAQDQVLRIAMGSPGDSVTSRVRGHRHPVRGGASRRRRPGQRHGRLPVRADRAPHAPGEPRTRRTSTSSGPAAGWRSGMRTAMRPT